MVGPGYNPRAFTFTGGGIFLYNQPIINRWDDVKQKKFLSVEICHLYLDRRFSTEQKQSIEKYLEHRSLIDPDHYVCVLLDNYNVKQCISTADEVIDQIESKGVKVDYWAYEKDLITYANRVIEAVQSTKLKNQYRKYIEKNNKYPCSLLTATWYLLRMGVIDDPDGIIHYSNDSKIQPNSAVVNILPNYFAPVESKARKIVLSVLGIGHDSRITNQYFTLEHTNQENK